MFVIKGKDNTYINNMKGIKIVHSLSEASKWNTKEKACNVLVNSCMNSIVIKHGLAVVEECEIQKEVKTEKRYVNNFGKVGDAIELILNLEGYKNTLTEKIVKVDKEICDLLHAAEFKRFNAYQGYEFYRKVRDARIRRREIKDELKEIEIFIDSVDKRNLDLLKRRINGLQNRKYKPRVLEKIF